MERLHFTALSYDDYSNYFKGSVKTAMFVSMNATKEFYDKLYKEKFEEYANELEILNGEVTLYPCYSTLQVAEDYSKFNMGSFDENLKKVEHEEQFPKDLENAYRIGVQLSR